MNRFTDQYIYSEIQKGNIKCFEYLFNKYYSELCRYSFSIIHNSIEAEEIVQGTLVKLWEMRTQIKIEISLKAYLYRTVHNHCLNFIEHKKVCDSYANSYVLENHDIISPISSDYPIANLLVQELDNQIQKAISELPDQCRDVFIKIRHDELSYNEAAEKLGITVNTVKTQLQRAMNKLREALKEYFPK